MKYELVASYIRDDGQTVQEILPTTYSSKKEAMNAQPWIDKLNQDHPEVQLFTQPMNKKRR